VTMSDDYAEVNVRGRVLKVPSARIHERTVIVTGKWLRMAAVQDEELVEGEVVANPAPFIAELKASRLAADVFSFAQRPPGTPPRHNFHFEWDNWAAIPITSFEDWWEHRLPQETRKNVRRAEKRGVTVRVTPFNDELVKGIQEIYNETPVRQGRAFWHYGKGFETVKVENGTYPDRSAFIGAYFNDELIGFIRVVFVDRIATLVQIIAKVQHQDKRPMNALLAKAVESCVLRGAAMLVYGKYIYGPNQDTSLTEFKRRNGFEEVRFVRYYVALNPKGQMAIWLGLHRGARALLPPSVVRLSLALRTRFYGWRRRTRNHGAKELEGCPKTSA